MIMGIFQDLTAGIVTANRSMENEVTQITCFLRYYVHWCDLHMYRHTRKHPHTHVDAEALLAIKI